MAVGARKKADYTGFISRDFPTLETAIQSLRQHDETVAEICRDYEEIATLVEGREQTGQNAPDAILHDLEDTLADLKMELLKHLAEKGGQ